VLEALDPLFPDSPNAVALGQTVMGVVALWSFWWAYRYAKPKKKEPKPEPQRRVDKAEGIAEVKRLCNPGRRSSDRCATCPRDETCLKRLPPPTEVEQARDRAAAQLVEARVNSGHPLGSVLFVDDNEELRKMAEMLLTFEGMRVRVAAGLSDLLPIHPDEDVLVTDWRLEDGTGADVIRAYREVRPDCTVIVCSALDNTPRDLPANVVYIRKPFDPDALCRLIHEALEG
jgi:CheY-like chemotaxis protein